MINKLSNTLPVQIEENEDIIIEARIVKDNKKL